MYSYLIQIIFKQPYLTLVSITTLDKAGTGEGHKHIPHLSELQNWSLTIGCSLLSSFRGREFFPLSSE